MAEIVSFTVSLHRKGRRLSLRLDSAGTIAADGDFAAEWEPNQVPAYARMLARKNPKEQKRVAAMAKAFARLLREIQKEELNVCASPKADTPGAEFCSPDERCPECQLREALDG